MTGLLSFLFFAGGALAAYWLWLRPLLKTRPEFAEFYRGETTFFAAAAMKFNTIKTKFAAGLVAVASVLVELHDFVLPAVTSVDWTPVTSQIPAAAWPFVSFGFGALFLWLRSLTARTQEVEVQAVAAGKTPEEAAVIAGKEPA